MTKQTATTSMKSMSGRARTACLGTVLAAAIATGCGGDGDRDDQADAPGNTPAPFDPDDGADDGADAADPVDTPTVTPTESSGTPPCPDLAAVADVLGPDTIVSTEPLPAHWCGYLAGTIDATYIYMGSMRSAIEERLAAGFESVPGVGEEATWNTEDDNQLAIRTGDDVGYVIEVFNTGDREPRALAIELAQLVSP